MDADSGFYTGAYYQGIYTVDGFDGGSHTGIQRRHYG